MKLEDSDGIEYSVVLLCLELPFFQEGFSDISTSKFPRLWPIRSLKERRGGLKSITIFLKSDMEKVEWYHSDNRCSNSCWRFWWTEKFRVIFSDCWRKPPPDVTFRSEMRIELLQGVNNESWKKFYWIFSSPFSYNAFIKKQKNTLTLLQSFLKLTQV